jgi:hypothetical protein
MSEISNENLNLLNKKYKASAMILIVQVVFSIALIAAGWFVSAHVENSISDESLMSLRIGVIFIAITTFVLRRVLFRWDRLKNVAILKGVTGLLSSLQANAIILGTFAEIIAIIGFLIAALGGVRTEMFTFGAVCLILFLINFPRKRIWLQIVGNLQAI